MVLQLHGKNTVSLFRLVSGIPQRKSLQIDGYALKLGVEGDLGNNYEREMVNRTEDTEGSAWGRRLGSREPAAGRAECYPSRESQMLAQHTTSQACEEGDVKRLSKLKARKTLTPISHLSTSKEFELELTGLINMTDYLVSWYLGYKIST